MSWSNLGREVVFTIHKQIIANTDTQSVVEWIERLLLK